LYLKGVEISITKENLNSSFYPKSCTIKSDGNLTCIDINDKEKDLIIEKSNLNEIVVDKNVSIFYDGSENAEKELLSLNKEKERLEGSILRREKLLSNENYVSKAPQNLVEQERKTLQEEKENLEAILAKLNK